MEEQDEGEMEKGEMEKRQMSEGIKTVVCTHSTPFMKIIYV